MNYALDSQADWKRHWFSYGSRKQIQCVTDTKFQSIKVSDFKQTYWKANDSVGQFVNKQVHQCNFLKYMFWMYLFTP